MRYFGGKHRIAKKIAHVLSELRHPGQVYLEPFVGAAHVISQMDGERIGSDNHADLILLLRAVQEGIDFPELVSETEYQQVKMGPPSAVRGFVGFGCSYAGKWFGGYARDKERNFSTNAKNSLLKLRSLIQDVQFHFRDYREWEPADMLIYCDPPYAAHTKIHGKQFDHDEFWDVMRNWSKKNTVIISEYSAPSDFLCIKEIPTLTDIAGKGGKFKRIEKLFQWLNVS